MKCTPVGRPFQQKLDEISRTNLSFLHEISAKNVSLHLSKSSPEYGKENIFYGLNKLSISKRILL